MVGVGHERRAYVETEAVLLVDIAVALEIVWRMSTAKGHGWDGRKIRGTAYAVFNVGFETRRHFCAWIIMFLSCRVMLMVGSEAVVQIYTAQ